MNSRIVFVVLAVGLAGLVPSGASLAAGCTPLAPGAAGGALSPASVVVGTLTWINPSAACPGGGADVLSLAAPCPTGYVGPLPGVFCGPLIAPGASGKCVWLPLVGGPSGLVAGYDFPTSPTGYDGNVGTPLGAGEGALTAGITPGVPFVVTNPSATFVGKLLAFPYNAGIGPSAEDVTLVTCGP